MRLFKIIAIFFACQFLNSFRLLAGDLILVNRGNSPYRIVIPVNATAVERKAAAVVQHYIDKISKKQLPIVDDRSPKGVYEILIGAARTQIRTKAEEDSGDFISIQVRGNSLLLSGGNRKGVLYSVYRFLTLYLGCQKYSRDLEIIPEKSTIRIPDNIYLVQQPSFDFRTTYFYDSVDETYCDWHGLNYFFEGRGSFAHTFNVLLPPKLYFSNNPDYFAWNGQKRIPSQPCLSNKNVFTIMRNNLEAEMLKRGKFTNWSVSQNDDMEYCKCSQCMPILKKGKGFSEVLIPFVNKMAKAFPNKTINTLAYNQSITPPVNSRPAKNVEITICLTGINRFFPIDDPRNIEGVRYRKIIEEWKTLTDNIFIWDYTVNYLHTLAPYPNLFTLQPNLKYFKTINIKRVFEQGRGPYPSELSELRTFLLANLMWNVNSNVDSLINDFTNAFYGPAGKSIRDYIYLLNSEGQKSTKSLQPWDYIVVTQQDYLSPRNIAKYKNIFAVALQKVRNAPKYYKRVKKESLCVDCAEINMATFYKNKMNLSASEIRSKARRFAKEVDEIGVPLLAESKNSPQQFLEAIEKALANPKRFLN